jgi:ketosteroid isomerase-like protein
MKDPQGKFRSLRHERVLCGRYVTVWHRQKDGGWLLIADMGVPN